MNTFEKLIQLEKQADDFGFSWPDPFMILKQITSECREIEENLEQKGSAAHLQEEIGDLLHAAFSLCIFCKFDPEATVKQSLKKFETRLLGVERLAKEAGYTNLQGQSFETFMAFWEAVKQGK